MARVHIPFEVVLTDKFQEMKACRILQQKSKCSRFSPIYFG